MPVPAEESGEVAVAEIVEKIGELGDVGATEEDTKFLKDFLSDGVLLSLVKTQDTLEGDENPEPADTDFISLVKEVLTGLEPHSSDEEVASLNKILEDAHFKGLAEAHDDIANKNYEVTLEQLLPDEGATTDATGPTDAIRMVGIRKNPDEPLGITVSVVNDNLVITRIMTNSTVDKLGLLHVGDVVREVNGQEVSTPEGLMDVVKKTTGSTITLKVIPDYVNQEQNKTVYMKAHFNYEPAKDNLIANKASGLAFQKGDVLQITSMEDKSWWQAKKYGTDKTGLIPSKAVEEKRRAIHNEPKNDQVKSSLLCGWARKKKGSYKVAKNAAQTDTGEVVTYEEVARLPAGVRRKALVLIGAQGIGRRSLKNKLIEEEPEKYAGVVRCTSRAPREGEVDGKYYYFCDKAEMEADIKAGKYLESGEYGSNFYGTKLDTVRDMLKDDKTAVLDVNTQAMKQLRTAEFMPYIVFVGSPSMDGLKKLHEEGKNKGVVTQDKTDKDFRRLFEESTRIERNFGHYFDTSVVNSDFDKSHKELAKLCENLGKEAVWVPVSWVSNINVNV